MQLIIIKKNIHKNGRNIQFNLKFQQIIKFNEATWKSSYYCWRREWFRQTNCNELVKEGCCVMIADINEESCIKYY